MANLKVLKLDIYNFNYKGSPVSDRLKESYRKELSSYQTEIPPVFYRDGIYKQGNICWFETDGRAFKHDIQSFEYQLRMYNTAEHDMNTVNLLNAIARIAPKILNSFQTRLVQDMVQLRSQRLTRLRSRKRIREFREKYITVRN